MKPKSLSEIAAVTGGKMIAGDPRTVITRVEIDSRKVRPGDLFWCLQGDRADAHSFIADVVGKGALGAVIEHAVDLPQSAGRFGLLFVDSTVRAIGALAKSYRKELPATVIGITGSVGKTSTKDLAASVLAMRYPTYKNPGNLNTHIGLPLALFGMDDSYRYAFLEMAMRKTGEIRNLCDMARPEVGILTDISASHLGELGSMENIADAKSELLESLPESGLAIVCGDNEWVRKVKDRAACRTVTYGLREGSDCVASQVSSRGADGSEFVATYRGKSGRYEVKAAGLHQVQNALPGIVLGTELGLDYDEIKEGLRTSSGSPMRLEVLRLERLTLINDAYNASPKSMKAALDLLLEIGGERRIAVLGDMLEMGDAGPAAHVEAGHYAAGKATKLFTVGALGGLIGEGWGEATGKTARHFPDKEAAWRDIATELSVGDTVLVKASRGLEFETLVGLLKSWGQPKGGR